MSKNVSASQSISLVEVNNCWFDSYVHFKIYGLVTFTKCHFTSRFTYPKIIFSIFRNNYAFKPLTEHLASFHLYADNHKIQLLQCNFTQSGFTRSFLIFYVEDVWREILVQQCSFKLIAVILLVGNKTSEYHDVVSAVAYRVENSTFERSALRIVAYSGNSFAFIRFNHVLFFTSRLTQSDKGGYVGFYLYNCTFLYISNVAIRTLQTIYINISHSYFELHKFRYCLNDGCVIHSEGTLSGSDLTKHLFFPTCTTHWERCIKLEIHNTQFIGTPDPNQVIIKTTFLSLFLCKTIFITSNQNTSFTGTALIKSMQTFYFVLMETTFDVSESISENDIPIIVVSWPIYTKIFISHIICPKNYKAVEILSQFVLSYSCKLTCEIDEYTYKRGSMILNGTFDRLTEDEQNKSLASNVTKPICTPCPVGAECEGTIQSLPNYWGFKDENNHVTMIRCPDGYCCQNNHNCQGISSCENGRNGTLCGNCVENMTESLLSPKCIKSEKCYMELILIMYFLASLSYALGVLTFSNIKKKVLVLIKKLYKLIRKKPLKQEQTEKVTTDVKKDNVEDDGMKYLQILFYYIQDAELFKVELPTNYEKEESMLIKFFQMSPEIIGTLYIKASEVCFNATTTALTKMWLKLMFGPCVMGFLFFFFFVQLVISKFKFLKEKHLKSMRSCLTRAFLIVYLFTYQQMIMGAFSLVQCVQVNNIKVLYIYGGLKCHTWWQVVIEIFIFFNIIPALFVLSSTLYFVRDRKMSLKVFHLACLFPIPVLVVYIFNLLMQSFRGRRAVSLEIISMTEHSSLEIEPNLDEDSDSDKSTDQCNVSVDTLGQKYFISSSDTDLGSEYSNDSIEDINTLNDSKSHSERNFNNLDPAHFETSREQVIHTLLEHYKTLKLFGFRFTWLGIHKLYRTILVVCYTYITEPLTRIYIMTIMLFIISVLNCIVKPYKKDNANIVAVFSYAANMFIAVVNIAKSDMMTFSCSTNCSFRDVLLGYLDIYENVLLIYIPIIAAGLWVISQGIKKCMKKLKDK